MSIPIKIPEELLHFVWRSKLMNLNGLETQDSQALTILNFGQYNTNAGPDFLEGSIRLEETTWYGQIEMHVNASDWKKHNHNDDPAYDNVILHVVWNYDVDIVRKDGSIIPTLSLQGLISDDILTNYESLISAKDWIPCQHHLKTLDKGFVPFWLSRLSIERVEHKTTWLKTIWLASNKDWDQTFYVGLCAAFGLKVNKDAFIRLAKTIPLRLLLKYIDTLNQVEALLFGGSGLLNNTEIENEYITNLSKEFHFLKQKHHVREIEAVNWKFSKLRPNNFPTVRIAQLAKLLNHHPRLFSELLHTNTPEEIFQYFDVSIEDGFWHNHYTFKSESTPKSKSIGQTLKVSIIINLIVPMLFLYGKELDEQEYCDASINLLESLNPESNAIMDHWKALGITPENAKESQALLELKNNYCTYKQCLQCQIGYKIIT